MPETPRPTYRFRDFELDVAAYALRRAGRAVRLERRPMDLLLLLVERRGELVERADIIERLWGTDVFVDTDLGVNTAIRKVRQALRDPAEAPVFLETVPGKGYRFIAPVELADGKPVAAADETAPPVAARRRPPATLLLALVAATALVSWAITRSTTPDRATLAVLPFENLGGDATRDYFADGLTEETISALGQIDPARLAVVGRTATLRYRGATKPLSEIAGELGADYLVEGSVRMDDGRQRITAKLIRGADQTQMWSQSYDSEPGSVLSLHRELSAAIAEQIRLRLSPERMARLARRQTSNREAYDLYLSGRHSLNQLTPPTTLDAIGFFERATALDPGYALAWSGIADAWVSSPINGDAPPLEVLPRARDAAERAVLAEPDLAEAQTSRAMVAFWQDWDVPGAVGRLRRAVELDPAYELAHRMAGVILAHGGRHAEAAAALRRAREIEPLTAMNHALSSHAAFLARDYPAAIAFARQAVVVDPQFWIARFQLAQASAEAGRPDVAMEELAVAERLSGGNSKVVALRGHVHARSGRPDQAREALAALEAASRERYVPPASVALVREALGDRDGAFAALERACAARDVHLLYLAVDPKWDGLRSDPRYAGFAARCGLAGTASARD